MNRVLPLASQPLEFISWFHTPAREIGGVIVLLIILAVVVEILTLLPDIARYIHLTRM